MIDALLGWVNCDVQHIVPLEQSLMRYPSFTRARRFGRRFAGRTLSVAVAGICGAILLTLLVLLLPLVAELLSTGGSASVPANEASTVNSWGLAPVTADAKFAHYQRTGMLPTVWRLRSSWIGSSLREAYLRFAPLRSNQGYLLTLIVTGWIISLLAAGAMYWLQWEIQRASSKVAGALRREIHSQAHRLGAGDLFVGQKLISVELFTDKTDAVRTALMAWWNAIPHAACFAALMLLIALAVDFWLALATVLMVVLTWWIFSELRRRARQSSAILSARSNQICRLLVEHLQQNRLLGNWSTTDATDAKSFEEQLRRYESNVVAQESTQSLLGPTILFFLLVGTSIVVLLAGFNLLRESPRLSLADFVLLASALLAMVYPLVRFEQLSQVLPEAERAATEIFVYLDREPRIGQMPDAAPLEELRHQIRFDKITLADIHGHALLDHVSCSFAAGQTTVIFSSSEATPLALSGLLPRFCDPAAGQVLFDNRDLRLATIESVRRQISLLLPEHVIAAGTIWENIVGDDMHFSPDDVWSAVKQSHAYEFIQSLPEGLETVVGPNGLPLNIGQAIRVGLARVALRRPSALVIEEPREPLDQVTAERVADALDRVTQGRTLVILARRLATLRNAPRILLFHEGMLVGEGTHQELLQHNELYRHLNYVRFSEFRDKIR